MPVAIGEYGNGGNDDQGNNAEKPLSTLDDSGRKLLDDLVLTKAQETRLIDYYGLSKGPEADREISIAVRNFKEGIITRKLFLNREVRLDLAGIVESTVQGHDGSSISKQYDIYIDRDRQEVYRSVSEFMGNSGMIRITFTRPYMPTAFAYEGLNDDTEY